MKTGGGTSLEPSQRRRRRYRHRIITSPLCLCLDIFLLASPAYAARSLLSRATIPRRSPTTTTTVAAATAAAALLTPTLRATVGRSSVEHCAGLVRFHPLGPDFRTVHRRRFAFCSRRPPHSAFFFSSSDDVGGGDGTTTTDAEAAKRAASTNEMPPIPVTATAAAAATAAARRTTVETVRKTRMFVASRNGVVLPWSGVYPRGEETEEDEAQCSTDGIQCADGIHPDPLDASSLLKLLPRGAYTTCRTVGRGTSVYQFEYHVGRLAESAKSMIDEGNVLPPDMTRDEFMKSTRYGAATDVSRVRDSTLECIRRTVSAFRATYGDRMYPCDEFRVTLLSTWLPREGRDDGGGEGDNGDDDVADMYCHVGILPKRREGEHIKVEVHGHGRSNAAAKDSRWVSERENSADHGCEEYILVNDAGEMLEGTQTNFYLVMKEKGGCILTADDGILRGSVRDSVLRVCEDHGVPLELRPPTVKDLEEASGAFLTSTSRMVLPIHEVVVNVSDQDVAGTPPAAATFHFPDCSITKKVMALVLEDVKTHCESIV